jgi:hypothetical protein
VGIWKSRFSNFQAIPIRETNGSILLKDLVVFLK